MVDWGLTQNRTHGAAGLNGATARYADKYGVHG